MDALPLPLDPRSPGLARRHLRLVVGDALPPARLQDALLLVSEAVTNAVVHGSGTAALSVQTAGAVVRVEVHDDAPGRPLRREADTGSPGGRGLLLLDEVADRWGVVEGRVGKTVWFELDVR